MSFNSIYTIFLRDLKAAVNDKTILLIIVIPVLISLAIPFLLTSVSNMTATVAVYDQGNSGNFISFLKSLDIYNVTSVNSMSGLNESISSGNACAAIIIPPGFDQDVANGTRPSLEVIVNPAVTESLVFTSTYRDVLMNYTKTQFPVNVTMELVQTSTSGGGGANMFTGKGIIPMVILMATVLLGVSILPYTLTTEKEKKTLDAILVSPASERDLIFGKMLFGLSLTVAVSLLVLAINHGFTGNIVLTIMFLLLGSMATVGLGLLVGSYSNSYTTASVISSILMLPLIMIPMFGPLSNTVATIAKVLPTTYMYNGLSDSMSGSGTLAGMLGGLAALVIFNVLIYALAAYLIRSGRNSS
jgi:ABC-2 type transport system permease protein